MRDPFASLTRQVNSAVVTKGPKRTLARLLFEADLVLNGGNFFEGPDKTELRTLVTRAAVCVDGLADLDGQEG